MIEKMQIVNPKRPKIATKIYQANDVETLS